MVLKRVLQLLCALSATAGCIGRTDLFARPTCDDSLCDDGNYCNGSEFCDNGACAHTGSPCIDAACDEDADACASTPSPAQEFDFTQLATLPPALSLTRPSIASYYDSGGVLLLAPSDTPRFDHDPVTHAPLGLLIEPATTNLVIQSEDLSNPVWGCTGEVTANSGADPHGTTTADRVAGGGSTFLAQYVDTGSAIGGRRFAFSIWVKGTIAGTDEVALNITPWSSFWVSTQVYGPDIRGTYPNWTRLEVAGVIHPVELDTWVIAQITCNQGGCSNDMNGTDVLLWGAQLEEQRSPTSYVPTSAVTATRAADIVAVVGPPSADLAHGTLLVQATSPWPSFQTQPLAVLQAAGGNQFELLLDASNRAAVRRLQAGTSVAHLNLNTVWASDEAHRVVASVDVDNVALTERGAAPSTTGITAVGSAAATILLGNDGAGAVANIHLEKFSYWTQALAPVVLAWESFAGALGALSLSSNAREAVILEPPTDVSRLVTSGRPPLSYSLVAGGGGTLFGDGAFASLVSGSSATVRVTDALSQTFDVTIQTTAATLDLDFSAGPPLDPRVTFSRASTATYFDASGVLRTAAINEPRFEHDPTSGEPLGLLIEGSTRTNQIVRSEQFETIWAPSGATIQADVAIAPDGQQTADKLVETNANTNHLVEQTVSVTSGATYSFSIFARAAGQQYLEISLSTPGGDTANEVLDLSTGKMVSFDSSGSMIWQRPLMPRAVGKGWHRFGVTVQPAATQLIARVTLHNGAGTSYLGDGMSGAYLWGAQLETMIFEASSYIPTTTAPVTAAAEQAVVNDGSWYTPGSGTFFIDHQRFSQVTDQGVVLVASDGVVDPSGYIQNGIELLHPTSNNLALWDFKDDVWLAGMATDDLFTLVRGRIAARVADNDIAFVLNGKPQGATTTALTPRVITSLRLDAQPDGTAPAGHVVRRLIFWPRALSDAELWGLTAQ